jgi:hypothetical protein
MSNQDIQDYENQWDILTRNIYSVINDVKERYNNYVSIHRYFHKWLMCIRQYMNESNVYKVRHTNVSTIMPYSMHIMSTMKISIQELIVDFNDIIQMINSEMREFRHILQTIYPPPIDLLEIYEFDCSHFMSLIRSVSTLISSNEEETRYLFMYDFPYTDYVDDAITNKLTTKTFLEDTFIPNHVKKNIRLNEEMSFKAIQYPCGAEYSIKLPNVEMIILLTFEMCVSETIVYKN